MSEICVERLKAELGRYVEEAEPEHAEPVVFVSSDENNGVSLWCRCCGRVASMSGAYYTHFRVLKPSAEGFEVNADA